jgi:autotransporter-associated beta strand protein
MLKRFLAVAVVVLTGQLVNGQTLPTPVATIGSFPPPAPDAFATSLRFSADGLIYAWDGQNVWRQSGVNVDSFGAAPIGVVPSNGADAGPINFSQDGKTLLIGNGSGGYDFSGSSSGLLFTMPTTGGQATPAGTLLYHFDFVPAPVASTLPSSATKFIVDRGSADFMTSEVDVFDASSGASAPLIRNIPGASSSIAFDSANRLYVSIGFGAHRGQIRRFTLSQLDFAASGMPLDWASGQLFNSADNNSGSGMLFDARGNLFVGGANGIAVFDSSGASQSYSTGSSSFPSISRNAANDQFALTLGGSDPLNLGYSPLIYRAADFSVPSPSPVTWTSVTGGNWTDPSRWNPAAPPNGIDQKAVVTGATTAPQTIILDAPITLGSLAINSGQKDSIVGSNALTMQVSSAIASINVAAGSHEIAAPVVLASDTDITVTGATNTLTLSGGISGSGMLSKEGNGTLVISAANSYTGNTAVDGGTLRFQVSSGSPSVASTSVVTVAPGATLELAAVVSAMGATDNSRAHIINDSTAAGLLVTGKNQVVGGIDGGGAMAVDAGSDLTADHIFQSAIMIGGNAIDHGMLTIAVSNPDGEPLRWTPSNASVSGEITGVPEPTSLLLALVGGVALFVLRFHRRAVICD